MCRFYLEVISEKFILDDLINVFKGKDEERVIAKITNLKYNYFHDSYHGVIFYRFSGNVKDFNDFVESRYNDSRFRKSYSLIEYGKMMGFLFNADGETDDGRTQFVNLRKDGTENFVRHTDVIYSDIHTNGEVYEKLCRENAEMTYARLRIV